VPAKSSARSSSSRRRPDRPPAALFDKLNTLAGARVGKWTALTGNLDLAAISKLDDRIASRIVREPGNLFIEMTTQDYGVRTKGRLYA